MVTREVKPERMDTANTIRQLLGEYERVRLNNQREGQRREREAREKSSEVAQLLDMRRTLLTQSMRRAFAKGGIDTEGLTAQVEQINRDIRDALENAGFAADYLQPIYRCPVCRDTGYVGEPVHELCACVKQRIMDEANRGERKGGLGEHSFEQFDLSVFPDAPVPGRRRSQREHMRLIERAARRYAEDFPDNERPNLIFFGPPGLGKTFIADCIAQRVMGRAYLVRRVTAYRLCEIMRRNQFDGSEARAVEGLMESDLLMIDDLGTEPQTKNTSGYLFQVFNERNMNGRHTLISTNLTPDRMGAQYEERVVSRMLDCRMTTAIEFYGRDLRLTKA